MEGLLVGAEPKAEFGPGEAAVVIPLDGCGFKEETSPGEQIELATLSRVLGLSPKVGFCSFLGDGKPCLPLQSVRIGFGRRAFFPATEGTRIDDRG